ncbi:hypothetical protein NOR51B_2112 [Luminiphilus syltensis NOR5-1B]|uniref:Uncharacterized protein n=1 Tax=Luminiphilus syltensis NOR5-1B TaxID=565045 RepID=B8KQC3_9GAMM|nr:hypothetical protein NOR51B_2112 [Luminiphilus syltensis NOR5-1B]
MVATLIGPQTAESLKATLLEYGYGAPKGDLKRRDG